MLWVFSIFVIKPNYTEDNIYILIKYDMYVLYI